MLKISGKDITVTGRLFRVARLEGEGYEFLEGDPEEFLNALKGSCNGLDLFTFIQRLPETMPRYHYPMEWDNFAAVEITSFDHWWAEIGKKTRNKVRQAVKKDVIINVVPFGDDLVKGIWEIYNECPIRQGRRYYHFGKDFETVYREEATHLDRAVFVGAFFHEKLIGFIKLVADETNTQAGLMNIVSMIKHRDKAPTNALIAEAVRLCAKRHTRYLVYSRFAYGGKEHSSISDFKQRNGMKRIDVPRYYVPLTTKGRLAIRLGLHRPLRSHIPEPVLFRLRQLRAAWYNRQLQSVGDSF